MAHMDIEVGPADDQERYLATDDLVWFHEVGSGTTEERLLGVPKDQRFAVDLEGSDPTTYPGIYGVRPMTLSVPGLDSGVKQVPVAGLTWVGVHPDHRRQGILTAMMRHHFEQVRESGVHLSALHASEPAIYGRHGYGLASLELTVKLSRGTTLTAPHLEQSAGAIRTQLVTYGDDGLPERLRACALSGAASSLGSIVGALDYYQLDTRLPAEELRDKEVPRVLFAQRDGVDVGFAQFRRQHKWEKGRPGGQLKVFNVVGDPATRLALLRRLVDFDLMGSIEVQAVGADDLLLQWAGGPRATSEVETYDSLWVRLVDLPEALQDRGYAAPCEVVVEVSDVAAPWNDGTWRIHVDEAGMASVERTSADADLRLPSHVLAASYLGSSNLVTALDAGLIDEQRTGSVRELWRALRTDVAPAGAIGF